MIAAASSKHRRFAAIAAGSAFLLAADATLRGEVRFDNGTRAAFSTDASNYRQVPIGVVVPRSVEDAAAVAVCRDHEVAVLSRRRSVAASGPAADERHRSWELNYGA